MIPDVSFGRRGDDGRGYEDPAVSTLVSAVRLVATSSAGAQASVAITEARAILRNMSLIIAKQLTQTYTSAGRPLTVLADVDLTIAPESFIAIVGPSGSGKTTLLGLLAGLDRPTAGRVELNGQDLSALTDDERARFRAQNVGFVFQTFQLIPTLTALENVMVPIELSGSDRVGAAR